MLGGEKEEIEEGQNIHGGYKCLAVNTAETQALLEKKGEYYLFEFADVKDEILDNIDAPLIGAENIENTLEEIVMVMLNMTMT